MDGAARTRTRIILLATMMRMISGRLGKKIIGKTTHRINGGKVFTLQNKRIKITTTGGTIFLAMTIITPVMIITMTIIITITMVMMMGMTNLIQLQNLAQHQLQAQMAEKSLSLKKTQSK